MKFVINKKNIRLINVTILFGNGALSDKVEGTAHFLEHLIVSSNNDKIKELASKQIFVNGYTMQDCIVFKMTCCKDEFNYAITLFMEAIFNWQFNEIIFQNERKIIEEEIKTNNQSIEKKDFIDFLSSLCGQNLHSEYGSLNSIFKITKNDLIKYYNEYFVYNNCIIQIDGRLNFFQKFFVKRLSKSYNGDYLIKNQLLSCAYNKELISIHDLGLSESHIFFVVSNNGLYNIDKILYELFLVAHFSIISEFWKDLRETNNLVYYIDYENIFIANFGFSVVQIDASKENLNKVIQNLHSLIENNLLSREIFLAAKNCLRKRMYEDLDNNINESAILKRKLYGKDLSLNQQIEYLNRIDFEFFNSFSQNIFKNRLYRLLIQK